MLVLDIFSLCPYCTIVRLTNFDIITGPPTHSVGGQTSNGRWCLSSSVTLSADGRAVSVPVTKHQFSVETVRLTTESRRKWTREPWPSPQTTITTVVCGHSH